MAVTVCNEPGCPELALGKHGKCGTHRLNARRASDRRRRRTRTDYSNRRWRETSRRYRQANPNCATPGCGRPATDVHHLDGHGLKGPRAHDWDNLEALCHPCHSRRTAREQPGGWNQR
jgi:5-methylcytosine-specific restriction protein A